MASGEVMVMSIITVADAAMFEAPTTADGLATGGAGGNPAYVEARDAGAIARHFAFHGCNVCLGREILRPLHAT
jgi:hypothetical protein